MFPGELYFGLRHGLKEKKLYAFVGGISIVSRRKHTRSGKWGGSKERETDPIRLKSIYKLVFYNIS